MSRKKEKEGRLRKKTSSAFGCNRERKVELCPVTFDPRSASQERGTNACRVMRMKGGEMG